MFRIACMAALLVCLSVGIGLADAPNLISYQGRLTNSGGTPLNGTYNLTFSIYGSPAGGVASWSETQSGVAVADGLFTVLLGSVTVFQRNLPPITFGDTLSYLGISVNGGAELTPRVRLASSAYALRVGTIDGARGGTIDDNITVYGWLNFGPGNLTDTRLSIPSDKQYAAVFTTTNGSSSSAAVRAEFSAVGTFDGVGIVARSVPADYYGVAGDFEGGYMGVKSRVNPTGANTYYGVDSRVTGGTGTNYGVVGAAASDGSPIGVFGSSAGGTEAYGVKSLANASNWMGAAFGVWSEASGTANAYAVVGDAKAGRYNFGVYGKAVAAATNTNYGVYGWASGAAISNYAGYFDGNVTVTGTLAKGGGAFKIDHPLDPENKYLQHSFVESPDMMNIYNGNVTTDASGRAIVTLPDYFEALNRDFRYQLTVIGQFAQAIIGEEIANRQFTIRTDKPNVKVSWQVTGIRHDAWAEKNRIQVEVRKNPAEKGLYLHPEAFGFGADKAIGYAVNHQLGESEARMAARKDAKGVCTSSVSNR